MRTFGRLLLAVILLGLVCGVVFYERPVWFGLQATHLGFFLSRVQSNYVMTPEGRVHYYEGEPGVPGGGIPLVLVHGLADRSESWAPMIKRLKRAGFHVYAPDLLGAGRSPKPGDSDYSIATQEKFVVDFIQSLGLQKTNIGGWSMGGWITLRLAADHPDMIDRVVVYDPAGIKFVPKFPSDIFHPTDGPSLQRLADLMEPHAKPLPQFVMRDALRGFAANQWIVDREMQSMHEGAGTVDDDLAKLQEPLLIVWGGDDHLLPVELGQQMHAMAPKSELDIVEGCGHLGPKTCPAREAAATADFLKANPVPAGQVRTLTSMQ